MLRYKLFSHVEALAYRWSSKRRINGVSVALLLPDADAWRAVEPKLSRALDLIARHAPVRFKRLLADVDGIWVFGDVGPLGVWQFRLRAIRIRMTYCLDPSVTPAQLACTIVHEATHAFLWRLGFRYPEAQRAQIERICVRSERVFLQRVPGEEALLEWKRSLPDPAGENYTQEAFQRSARRQLREMDTPRWAMYLLGARPDESAAEPVVGADPPGGST